MKPIHKTKNLHKPDSIDEFVKKATGLVFRDIPNCSHKKQIYLHLNEIGGCYAYNLCSDCGKKLPPSIDIARNKFPKNWGKLKDIDTGKLI